MPGRAQLRPGRRRLVDSGSVGRDSVAALPWAPTRVAGRCGASASTNVTDRARRGGDRPAAGLPTLEPPPDAVSAQGLP